ncbi:hypothetical protein WICPIJ_001222, partial [Wickerhamomyces pijperi]
EEEEDITSYYANHNERFNSHFDDSGSSSSEFSESEDEEDLVIPPRMESNPQIHTQVTKSPTTTVSRSGSQIRFQLPPKRSNTTTRKVNIPTPTTLFSNPQYVIHPPAYSSLTANEKKPSAVPVVPVNKPANPYANSLWYNARGSFGNQAIDAIQERVQQQRQTGSRKRAIEEYVSQSGSSTQVDEAEDDDDDSLFVPPQRDESLAFKKVDSPILSKHFFTDPSKAWNVVDSACASPKYKGLSPTGEQFGKAFKELFDTELKYSSDLNLIESVYRALFKSRKYRNVVSTNEEKIIFSNIASITELSLLFLKQIRRLLRFEGDIFNPVVSLSEVDIGQLLLEYFNRIKGTYASYFQTHEARIATLEKCQRLNGPKYEKWLADGAYLCKAQSDCWDLESLLVKPIQRVSKYLLLLNVLIDSVSDAAGSQIKDNLVNARTHLERWLDELNSSQRPRSADESCDDSKLADDPVKKQVYEQHYDTHQAHIHSIDEFKAKYSKLQQFARSVEESMPPMLKFIRYQRHYAETWHRFMQYQEEEDNDCEEEGGGDEGEEEAGNRHYIHSVYNSYTEKLSTQETQTKLAINSIHERIIKATSLTLETCESVRHHIKSQTNSKPAYLAYLANPTKTPSRAVQEYITIQNQLQDELPKLNKLLEHFCHYISLDYAKIISEWLSTLAGDKQIAKYLDLVKSGEFTRGDNFDIIEIYSAMKIQTKEALRDLCVDLSASDIFVRSNQYAQLSGDVKGVKGEVRISSSRVVRRLFGV